jgi:hypothetical protein
VPPKPEPVESKIFPLCGRRLFHPSTNDNIIIIVGKSTAKDFALNPNFVSKFQLIQDTPLQEPSFVETAKLPFNMFSFLLPTTKRRNDDGCCRRRHRRRHSSTDSSLSTQLLYS